MSQTPKSLVLDLPATLHLDSWAGRRTYAIRVTGETRENYRFRALEDIPLPRSRYLEAGSHGRAPKRAVVFQANATTTQP